MAHPFPTLATGSDTGSDAAHSGSESEGEADDDYDSGALGGVRVNQHVCHGHSPLLVADVNCRAMAQ